MLLETKAFTEMALVWGSTFSVTVGIIFVILCLALLSNEMVIRGISLGSGKAFLLLILSVLVGYLSTFANLSGAPWLVEGTIRAVLLTIPVSFAGICFSRQISDDSSINRVMSSNLLGAIVGGILEYTSMLTGFRALYLGVAVLYLLAYFCHRKAAHVTG
jgi:hypothetical protein